MTGMELSMRSEPSEIARAALAGIESDADGFDMRDWCANYDGAQGRPVEADAVPSSCGTTLCAAGWVAHALGYVVFPGGDAVPAHSRTSQKEHVEQIANRALRLKDHHGNLIWYSTDQPERSLALLRAIADGATGGDLWDVFRQYPRD